MITLEFADGDSVMTVSFGDGYINIQRPNKGMTPKLRAVAEKIASERLFGNDLEKVKAFLDQTDDLSILVGEERCG